MCEGLAKEQVEIVALPIDVDDDEEKLTAYVERFQPRYRLRRDLSTADRLALAAFLNRHLQTTEPPLPATIVTDHAGNTLQVTAGLLSASEIRKLISMLGDRE